jgi:hypothetical protein
MNVSQLIEILKTLPQQKPVFIFWDGSPRGPVEGIVNDDTEVVIVGDWSIYRKGSHRHYEESKIVFG